MTRTQIAFHPFGLNADGRWKPFSTASCYTMEDAAEKIADHRRYSAIYPKDFTQFTEYKIMKRTIVTTYGEWEEA